VLDIVVKNRSFMNTIRQRQKNWLDHVLRSESLLCTVLEGRMEGTGTCGRQSDMMIDWMKSNDGEYKHIKKRAYDREDWCHWRRGPAWKGRALKREIESEKFERSRSHLLDDTNRSQQNDLAKPLPIFHFSISQIKWQSCNVSFRHIFTQTHMKTINHRVLAVTSTVQM